MPIVHKNNGKVKLEKCNGEKTAALHNLGCKVNAYETEALRELLIADGYRIVPFTEEADVYIVNTCTVTNIADKKSRQMLRRARKRRSSRWGAMLTRRRAISSKVGSATSRSEMKTKIN